MTCDTFGCQDWLLGGAFAHSEGKAHAKVFYKLDTPCPQTGVSMTHCLLGWLPSGVNFSGLRSIQSKAVPRGQQARVGGLWARTVTLLGLATAGQRRAGLSLTAGQSLQSAASDSWFQAL